VDELREFERQVIDLLAGKVLSRATLEAVKSDAEIIDYRATGHGYFLTLRHPELPRERRVCHQPLLRGDCGGIDTGFVIFLENGQLTLECHGWGDKPVPHTYRDGNVQITAI
jgi:hypothetical protein